MLILLLRSCSTLTRIWAGQTLKLEPEVTDMKYCLEPNNVVVLEITLLLRYRNLGDVPLTLFANETDLESNRSEIRKAFPKSRMFNVYKIDKRFTELFYIIGPGASSVRGF